MDSEQLDELCRRIYKNHRKAIDLIWERVESPKELVIAEVHKVLDEDERWDVAHKSNDFVDFVPVTWLKWLPAFDPDVDDAPFAIQIWATEKRLALLLFLSPMKDPAHRSVIVQKLREVGPNAGFKRTTASKKVGDWNRLSSPEDVLVWGVHDSPDEDVIRGAVKKVLDELEPRLKKLEVTFKPLCETAAEESQK